MVKLSDKMNVLQAMFDKAHASNDTDALLVVGDGWEELGFSGLAKMCRFRAANGRLPEKKEVY